MARQIPETKGRAIYDGLRDAILVGSVRPGEQLVAREMARELGVSVIPVREALHRLAAEGLVTIQPHVGAFVTELKTDELIEYLEVRLVLECLAVEKAAAVAAETDLVQLEACLTDLEEAVASANWSDYARHNRSFHRNLYRLSKSRVLLSEIERLFALSERGQSVVALDTGYAEKSQSEHRELVEAIRARNPALATAVMRRHRQRNVEALRQRAPKDVSLDYSGAVSDN